ncbi:MAG: nicotinate phosphoribosyltransferase, partial [Dehalococcoidia bacterium]|nr:nicotinate phosphoribosyltransferase [Dehalococcoidia bacterium]
MPHLSASGSLFTDLYQLTMAQSYYQSGQTKRATFGLFFRNFPPNRAYYVFSGLESALDYLEHLKFDDEDIGKLSGLDIFDSDFLDYLRDLTFTGDVRAMREGEIFFENEPVMEVSGPIIECQLVETFLLNRVNLESMLATKAARVADAAAGKSVVDFAARRTHGLDAGMKQARASYIAGFDGTSNVAAATEFGIPAVGTMSHSFISSFESELEAFRAYAESFPDSTTLLVDTYETLGGVANAIAVAQELESQGHKLRAIRLDSGDLGSLARSSRTMLDESSLDYVQIIASGGLDEYSISDLLRSEAPIDGFGVGGLSDSDGEPVSSP